MPTQVTAGEGVPSVFYRNAIDLNRFSNGIARKIARENVFVIIKASKQLQKIDESKGPSYRAARLRSLIKQTKDSLSKWQQESVDVLIKDLEGVAKLQTGFVEDQIKKALPSGMRKEIVKEIGYSVQSVAVSPGFAKAVVTNEPTDISFAAAARSQQRKAGAGVFNLTAKQGAELTLPNGDTVKKAFRGLASQQANRFNQIVRTGLLSGEPTQDIARQLVGTLDFGDKAKTLKQLGQAGGEATKMATHQINTIVRTSVNQVSNAASQSVYKANKRVTKEYRYLSTLDSKTSPVCRNLDGQIFEYGKGPEPPQHFNCRSTTVPVIDYKGNGWPAPPSVTTAKRASADGPVPANTTYGKWLYDKRKAGTKFTPGPEQIKVLGTQKAKYFNRLSNKYGPDEAMKKFMREDNSETSLATLQKRYGRPEDIKPRKKKAAAPKAKVTPKKKAISTTSAVMSTDGVDSFLKTKNIAPDSQQFIEESLDSLEGLGGLIGVNTRKMRQFMKKSKMINHFNMKGEKTNFDQVKKKFLSGDGLKAYNAQFKIVEKRFDVQLNKVDAKGKRATSKEYSEARFYWMQRKDVLRAAKGKEFDDIAKKHLFKNSGGMSNGFTSIDSNIIHTRIYENSKKIGSLQAKQIKKSAKATLDNNALLHTSDWDYMMKHNLKEVWSTSQPMSDEISWFSTMIHETGHQVHFQSGAEKLGRQWMKLKGLTFTTEYSRKNYLEQFAEAFTQYVLNPDGLKEHAPRLYNWVDASMEEALKSL